MVRFALVASVLLACGDNKTIPDAPGRPFDDAPQMDGPPIDGNPLEPDTLFGTGLCLDKACTMISPDVHEYAPQDILWADTATKRRWIYLPPGTTIDTSDMNHWNFPAGAKIWKEFTRDGVRVETRYIAKLFDSPEGPNDPTPWFYITYQWNSSPTSPMGDDTTAVTQGVQNANGTPHDIPSRSQCKGCHERVKPGRVLGFSAMSLDFHQTDTTLLDLDGAIAAGMLSVAPPGAASPHFPFPADATAADIAMLGYAHANCGECHNPSSDVFENITPVDLRLDVTKLDARANTPLFASTIGKTGGVVTDMMDTKCTPLTVNGEAVAGCTQIIVPDWTTATDYKFNDRVFRNGNVYACSTDGTGHDCGISATGPTGTGTGIIDGTAKWDFIGDRHTRSIMTYRFETTNISKHMPAAGSEMTDPDGDTILNTWIDSLP